MGIGMPCLARVWKEKPVLVTGGKGFVGSYTVDALKKRGINAFTYDIVDGQDITNLEQLQEAVNNYQPSWIIHLAGQVNLAPSFANPQNDARINIVGTLNVLEVARKANIGVTFSSSGAVYGDNYQYPEPVSPYGISKLTAETYCKLYSRLYNLHAVVFRFSSVYGKGRAPTSINLIAQKAKNGETIRLTGDGNQTRDFTYVTDVAEALVMSSEGCFPSGIYDIGTGTATSLNDLIRILERLLGKKINIEYAPVVVGDPKRNEMNVSKLASFGFKAKTSLEDGLRRMISQ